MPVLVRSAVLPPPTISPDTVGGAGSSRCGAGTLVPDSCTILGSIRPPEGARLGDELKAHLLTHPVGREIFVDAEYIEGDVKAYSMLPYYAERIAGPGWQIVGDAASFMDPLYSQGLDYCAWTVSVAVDRIVRESQGRALRPRES